MEHFCETSVPHGMNKIISNNSLQIFIDGFGQVVYLFSVCAINSSFWYACLLGGKRIIILARLDRWFTVASLRLSNCNRFLNALLAALNVVLSAVFIRKKLTRQNIIPFVIGVIY